MPEKTIDENLGIAIEKTKVNEKDPEKSQESSENNPEQKDRTEKEDGEPSLITEKVSENDYIVRSALVQSSNTEREKKIEGILEVDLAEVFKKLSLGQRKEFKSKGEETALTINKLLDDTRLKAKKILSLIKDWLQMIPGVNKYFIEQLAKSKLDEIMKLKK